MLTQCPGCQTVFRVTSTILRAAHGQVRCGRCQTQFDAIEQLLDGEDPEHPESPDSPAPKSDAPADAAGQDYPATALSHEEIVLEGTRIEISGIYQRVDAQDSEDSPAHSRTVIEEFNIDTEEWENPFVPPADNSQDLTPSTTDPDEAELEDVEQELAAVSLADAMASLDTTPLGESVSAGSAATMDAAIPAAPAAPAPAAVTRSVADAPLGRRFIQGLPPTDLDDIAPFAHAQPARRWPWLIASTILSVMLIAQALHHSRESLARHPSFGPQLSKLYAAIGQPLTPQWQLQAYNIKQWGIVSDPQEPGTLRVRASVTNGADFAQPYPLLQLSLEDRFGGKVGARAFTPDEYLDSTAQATRLLAAGEAANIDLAIVDPGQDAVGFQFDTCLLERGVVLCTHDL